MEPGAKLGYDGQAVAARIRSHREEQRLSVRDLSARLTAIGRPILPSGVVKLEQGVRRIDIDDLIAIAQALDVAPAVLLVGGEDIAINTGFITANDAALLPIRQAVRQALADGFTVSEIAAYVRVVATMYGLQDFASAASERPERG